MRLAGAGFAPPAACRLGRDALGRRCGGVQHPALLPVAARAPGLAAVARRPRERAVALEAHAVAQRRLQRAETPGAGDASRGRAPAHAAAGSSGANHGNVADTALQRPRHLRARGADRAPPCQQHASPGSNSATYPRSGGVGVGVGREGVRNIAGFRVAFARGKLSAASPGWGSRARCIRILPAAGSVLKK